MQNEFDILVIGSLNMDLVVTTPRFPKPGETLRGTGFQHHCGGKGANQAYAAATLGAKVAMMGRVGADSFGESLRHNLETRGVDTALTLNAPGVPTGTALITVDEEGENQIIIVPGANAQLTARCLSDREANAIQVAKLILLQLEIPFETVEKAIHLAQESASALILDPAPATKLPPAWLSKIDYLTPNLSELSLLTGRDLNPNAPLKEIALAARILCEQGARCIIVKLGPRGALRVDERDSEIYPAREVTSLDSTAAGDSFNAAFAVSLSKGLPFEQAIPFAVHAATLSVTKSGAQSSMPSLSEVEAFIAKQT